MFFKTKVMTADYCREKLERLFSREHKRALYDLGKGTIWLMCGDEYLKGPDETIYINNMRAAIIQLMRVSIAHSFNRTVHMDMGNCVADYLKQQPEIEALCKEYNKAFGSSFSDGVAAMVELFATKFPASVLAQSEIAKAGFHEELYNILRGFYEEFKSIKLVDA